jgi:8-oxo-dGTP pyrophosphatase MutT (NUDIX family)
MTIHYETLRSRMPGREAAPVPAGTVETSVTVILAPGETGPEVLFIRRAEREGDPWSGHIGLPGGRREPGDADLLETALRETREEIGVDLPRACLLGALEDLNPSVPTRPARLIRPFVFGVSAKPEAKASDEVVESYWVPLAALAPCEGDATVSIKGQRIQVPCFRVAGLPPGLVVWGLTYRILRGLLPLLG